MCNNWGLRLSRLASCGFTPAGREVGVVPEAETGGTEEEETGVLLPEGSSLFARGGFSDKSSLANNLEEGTWKKKHGFTYTILHICT